MTTMIDARGWKAAYKGEHGQYTEPLLFWLSDGGIPIGYIMSNRTGHPRSAESISNFDGYVQNEEADAVTVPAEPGWYIVERDHDNPGRAYWTKVLAWRIFQEGWGVKAIGAPLPDGSNVPYEPTEDKIQFIFDPARAPELDGPWPVSAYEVAA